jgi:hypothetical protein
MFLIIGLKYFTWGSETTSQSVHCGNCGVIAPFLKKKGMRFITLFFIIPTIPISGLQELIECPNCHSRYQANSNQ